MSAILSLVLCGDVKIELGKGV